MEATNSLRKMASYVEKRSLIKSYVSNFYIGMVTAGKKWPPLYSNTRCCTITSATVALCSGLRVCLGWFV